MSTYLNISVGTPENSHESFLFLDLMVAGREITVESSQSLDGISGDEFLDELEQVLNTACLLSKELKLHIKVDLDGILEEADEEFFDEDSMKNIKKLVKEVLEEKGA